MAPHDCYAGTWRLLNARRTKRQFDVAFVDKAIPEALEAALARVAKAGLDRNPEQPADACRRHPRDRRAAKEAGAKTVVDNTFLSPALQQPIRLGADLVVHSTTKFLNGHSDVVGGVVVAATQKEADDLRDWANATGVTGSPFDAFLTLRGVRTLFTRVETQQKTTGSVVAFLDAHPAARVVHYPGLPAHPGHEIASAQQSGFRVDAEF